MRINAPIRKAIWDSIEDKEIKAADIFLDDKDGDTRKIWEQLKNHLPVYALFKADRPSTDQDAEAQDPLKAAVKEALKSKEEELRKISQQVKEEVEIIAKETVKKLAEMHPHLASELRPRFAEPKWDTVFKVSLTDHDEVPINKRGSGVRRLILLNFLRARAEQKLSDSSSSSSIIYAIEEPETSQHPDNQRMLMHAFEELAQQPGKQVMISTHTPMLGRLMPVNALRYIEYAQDKVRNIYSDGETTYGLVARALGVLPDHTVKVFVGVEGVNDINFLKRISRVLIEGGENVPDLSELEKEGQIIFIPVGGSNLALWVSRLAGLNIPEVHIYDRDTVGSESPHYQSQIDALNSREGCQAFSTTKRLCCITP